MMDMLATTRVRILTFAPHATDISQFLNLTLFGTFKLVGEYHLPFDDLTPTSHFSHKLYTDFKRTLTPVNLWAAFGGIVIEFNMIDVPSRVLFHSEKLRKNKEFTEA
jgi:hypothetical protein